MDEKAFPPSPIRARYVVKNSGGATRMENLRPLFRTQRHPMVFAMVVAAWALANLLIPHIGPAMAAGFVFGPVAAFLAFRCFDVERHRGRRRVRQSLVFGPDRARADYRTNAGAHIEIDGEVAIDASDARLVFGRTIEPGGGSHGPKPPSPDTELCLVAAGRVYLVATALEGPDIEEGDPVRVSGDGKEWRASTIHGLAVALLEATEGRIPLEPSPFDGAAVRRVVANPWPSSVLSWAPMMACWLLVVLHWLIGFTGTGACDGLAAAYLGLFALLVFPAQALVHMARTAARAPAVLRKMYGDVGPFPGATRWRPWPAFFLSVALPVAFAVGWAHLFPAMPVWSQGKAHTHVTAGAAGR